MVYIFLADGFEETEALTPLDILRRSGIEAKTVGVTGKSVTGSHNITVSADITLDEISFSGLEAIVLPGGMPGTLNLEKSDGVQKVIDYANDKGLIMAAICAAPSILGHKNILKGKKATCFTGFEKDLTGAFVISEKAVIDGNVITAYGAGAAFEFGFLITEKLKGRETAEKTRKAMRFGEE